jgi:hypothetical protein
MRERCFDFRLGSSTREKEVPWYSMSSSDVEGVLNKYGRHVQNELRLRNSFWPLAATSYARAAFKIFKLRIYGQVYFLQCV